MKVPFLLVVCLFLTIPVEAQQKVPFWKDKHFWISEAIMGTAVIADVQSSIHASRACPVCEESSLLLPKHPSDSQHVVAGFGVFAFETGVNILSHRLMSGETNKYWRFAGRYAWPITAATLESLIATRGNYKIISDCNKAKLVCR